MNRARIPGAVSAALAAVLLLGGPAMPQSAPDHHLLLKVGDRSWEYHTKELMALASRSIVSHRGTKKNPAIPLEVLVTKDTGVPVERIIGVIVVGEDKVLFLEGDRLRYLGRLILKFGSNHLTLAPEDDETLQALRPYWGRGRIEDVVRVDVLERR